MDSTPFNDAFLELNQRFIKLVGDLSALRALSNMSTHSMGEERTLLRNSMRILMENNDFERCSIFLLDGEDLNCVTGLDWPDMLNPMEGDNYQPHVFRVGEGIIGMAAETGNLQHCRDSRREPRFVNANSANPIGSLISVPVIADDRVLGVVNVSHSTPNFFTESHERLLHVFANFLGQTLANWRYAHEMEEEIRRRTKELQSALSEAEELKRRYQHLSVVDELTGIHNRRFFFPEAHSILANALRHRHDFSIMMIDLDRFKQINDRFGHVMGDKVLQVTAALLKGQTREGDIIARFGGEEFVMALPETDIDGTRQLADRILQSLRSLNFSTEQGPLRVTTSIGIACLTGDESPDQTDLLESLLRQADQALYYSKANGRDQTCSYQDIQYKM